MHNLKVSVTVPVYNTSKYINQCIESLKTQNLEDIEFIVVDDGSTDDSLNLCKDYIKNDPRFHIVHQNNGGLAAARQTGLNLAKGEYIIVCDSDDWVEPEMYKILYDKAKETDADIVTCGFYTEYGEKGQSNNYIVFKEHNGIVDNYDLIKRGAGWSWIKLIRRSLFVENQISYKTGINLSEDSLIVYKLMRINPKVVQVPRPLYHYRREYGGKSYTNNLSMKHILQLDYTYFWLKNNYQEDKWSNVIRDRAIDLAFACLRVSDLDYSYLNQFLKKELPFNLFFKEIPSLKGMVVFMTKIFPIKIVKNIVKLLYPFVYS